MRVDKISGPVSAFGLELISRDKSNKIERRRVFLFGDVHFGKHNQCKKCESVDHCYGLTDLFDRIFSGADLTDFYLETSYLPKDTHPADLEPLYKQNTNFLEHLRQTYKECFIPYRIDLEKLKKDEDILKRPELQISLKKSEECFARFPNTRFHYTDLRLDPENPIGRSVNHLTFRKSRQFQTSLEVFSEYFQKYLSPGPQLLTSSIVSFLELFHWIFFQDERNFKKDGLYIRENLLIYCDILIYSDRVSQDLKDYYCRPKKDDTGFVVKTKKGDITRIRKALLKLKPTIRKTVLNFYEHRKRILSGMELPIVPLDEQKRPYTYFDAFALLMDIYLISRLLYFLNYGMGYDRKFKPGQRAVVFAGDLHIWNYREYFAHASKNTQMKIKYLFSSPRSSVAPGPLAFNIFSKFYFPSRCKNIGNNNF